MEQRYSSVYCCVYLCGYHMVTMIRYKAIGVEKEKKT